MDVHTLGMMDLPDKEAKIEILYWEIGLWRKWRKVFMALFSSLRKFATSDNAVSPDQHFCILFGVSNRCFLDSFGVRPVVAHHARNKLNENGAPPLLIRRFVDITCDSDGQINKPD